MAKRFFFVCAGLLCLALSFHLGQVTAQAQSGATIEGGNIGFVQAGSFPRATGCVDRIFRWMGENGALHEDLPVPVPGTQRIIATDPFGTVLLENGDWYKWGADSWVLIGNLSGGPTPAQRKTWGAMKFRYRGERGAAEPQDK